MTTVDNRRITRKISINLNHHLINVRPLIKAAFKEASHTLTEAYLNNIIIEWCVQNLERKKYEQFLYTLFKQMVNSCTLQSRDFALQVDGCKGILTWTNDPTNGSVGWPRVLSSAKLARLIGWTAALRAVTKVAPSCDRMKREIMSCYPRFITITFIGVLAHEQHKGYGSALVSHVLEKADEAKYPVYIEATDPSSVMFFETFGFTVKATVYIANHQHLPVSLMVRLPSVIGSPKHLPIRPGRRDSDD